MRETADIGQKITSISLPPEALRGFGETRKALRRRSAMVWGEHCTECAFPSCYSSCSFYTPRGDMHCRRFEHGIERVRAEAGGVALMRIEFRRWGKLEGQGSVGLKPAAIPQAIERLDPLVERTLKGPASFRNRAAWRWNECKRILGAAGKRLAPADVFILEAWHEGRESWPFTFSVMPRDKKKTGLFQTGIALAPGYSRTVISAARIACAIDLDQPLTLQVEPVREGAPPIVFGMMDFATLSRPLGDRKGQAGASLPKFKCVVWDLDNTLWQGVLAEDGIEGVTLAQAAAGLVRELDRRGIVNSIASKNDPELADAALEKFGLKDYFVFPKIGWAPKSEGLKAIIAEMDVGADTFAFIDDQAFERGEIGELLPEVTVFSEADLPRLLDEPRFDVPVTAESGKRRRMYQTEERRILARAASQMDYGQFLRSCRIRLEVRALAPANLPRIYELSQRTNQLNFSGLRYSQDQLERLMAARPQDTFVLACSDKFGEYGVIGFCVLSAEAPRIESFFMSCRVQRKKVENAFFQFLANRLAAKGASRLEAAYRKTARNRASVEMLGELGFAYEAESETEGVFGVALPREFAESDLVEVDPAPQSGGGHELRRATQEAAPGTGSGEFAR